MRPNRKIIPMDLERTARSIATNYGDKGAIVITVSSDGFRIGVADLTDRELQDALCVAIYHNVRKSLDDDDAA